jgi:2-aminoethylphosphonate-pyruvate transaminase
MEKLLLFTPGPVNVAANVRVAIAREDICHREIEFEELLRGIEGKLLQLFEIRNRQNYQAVVITGSGTAANEAMLSSVVGNQNVLILSNGEFGERLHAISQIHNESTSLLQFPWGDSIDLEIVNTYLQSHRVDFIALVHHETSSGMLNPLAAIGALARANGAVLLVDCVSSVGAESIDMERDNIAFCSSSSSKAIGSYPGLSFVIGKTDEFEKLRTLPAKSAYLNLYRFFEFSTGRSQTPNTPAVPLFFALDQALANILIEGVPQRRAKILRTATTLREEMKELGLSFLLKSEDMSSVLTTVFVPPYVDINLFRQRLREKSIIIYEGKGPLKGRVFQVGNIGELSKTDTAQFLAVLRDTLDGFHAVEIITTTILPHSVIDPGVLPSLALAPIFATSGVLNTTGGLFRTGDGEQLMAIQIDLDPLISEVTESV